MGLALPQYGPALADARGLRKFASSSEEIGYDTLWCGDRLFTPVTPDTAYPGGDYRPYLERIARGAEPFTLVATAAAVTERVRFNFSTLNAPVHEPVQLARTLTTLDFLSDGRMNAGFGLSWMRDEYDAVGLSWAQRGRRLDDILDFLAKWWTTNPVSFESQAVSVPPTRVDLRPVQPGGPPIWLGGASAPAFARIGRRAVGWLGFDRVPQEFLAPLWEVARRAADDAGRDPQALQSAVRVNVDPGESPGEVAARVERVREAGADEVVVDYLFASSSVDETLDLALELMARQR
ncbi:TIGR03619 family F420-dependent LLM class oxidoreductase [Amycolatopsis jiangsuensis]|nr:TIGR03619 family F420-dependent LLM class oxidoreductase [Amycolatopsis jiangsuensis]